MITDFNELRQSIEPPEYKRDRGTSIREEREMAELIRHSWFERIEYAKTMALIHIAQELNDIKYRGLA